jgi:hypothetical protein
MGLSRFVARRIMTQRMSNGSGVFLLRGPKKCGKSTVAAFVAVLCPGAIVTKEYRWSTPGFSVTEVVRARDAIDPEVHLIMEIDEFEECAPFGTKAAVHCPDVRTEVLGESDHMKLMDLMAMTDNLLVFLTTNEGDDAVAKWEADSLIRPGRITAHYKFMEDRESFEVVHERVPMPVPIRVNLETSEPEWGAPSTPATPTRMCSSGSITNLPEAGYSVFDNPVC